MKVRYLVLSMLGFPKDTVKDLSELSCYCSKDDDSTIPLHLFRILTYEQPMSWYIGTHGYSPKYCSLEDYQKSAKFFRNLTLKKLEQLNEENTNKYGINFKKFYTVIRNCFENARQNDLFKEEDLTEISFSAFAKTTYESKDKNIHQIFHTFINEVNRNTFKTSLSLTYLGNKKEIEKSINETKNSFYEYVLNLCFGNDASKEIKMMNF